MRLSDIEFDFYKRKLDEAVAAERERCAKIAEVADRDRYANQIFQGVEIAAKIRNPEYRTN